MCSLLPFYSLYFLPTVLMSPPLRLLVRINWTSHRGVCSGTVISLMLVTAWELQKMFAGTHWEQSGCATCKPKSAAVEVHTQVCMIWVSPDNLTWWISYRLVFIPSLVILSVRQWIDWIIKMSVFRRFCPVQVQHNWHQHKVWYLQWQCAKQHIFSYGEQHIYPMDDR